MHTLFGIVTVVSFVEHAAVDAGAAEIGSKSALLLSGDARSLKRLIYQKQ